MFMKYAVSGLALLSLTIASAAQAQLADTAIFTDAELKALGAKGGSLISKGATVTLARRVQSGMVEVHDNFSDVLIAREGHVTLTTGGTVSGNKESRPGEWMGGEITGGTLRELGPGDVVWIPAGVPHLMTLKPGETFVYLAVKVPAPPKP
jgi:mannose-6-phosphate isomerase-like protein (cupin superfamily)